MNYIELQTAVYHSFVELMTVLFIPFSLLTLTMSVLDYIRH